MEVSRALADMIYSTLYRLGNQYSGQPWLANEITHLVYPG